MLGTVHILMIRHGLYASLPHRRGEGGTGTATGRRQELRRQLRFVRRNLELIANLVRLRANLPVDPEDNARLLHQRAKLRARLLTHRQNAVIRSEARSTVILSKGPAIRPITRKCRSERQQSEPNESRRRRVRLGRPVRERSKEANPTARAASTAIACAASTRYTACARNVESCPCLFSSLPSS
jgi:hypothetical protein